MIMPATRKNEATEKQKELLQKHNLWKEGMTFEEASEAINKIKFEGMKCGLHLLKIKSIEEAKNKDDENITDKDGNPAIRITFINKDNEIISDVYFYSTDPKNNICKSEWKLRKLKSAMGLVLQKTNTIEEINKKKFFAIVRQIYFIDENDEYIRNEKNDIKGYTELSIDYFPENGKPIIAGNPALDKEGLPSGKFLEKRIDKKYIAENKKVFPENDDEFSKQTDEKSDDAKPSVEELKEGLEKKEQEMKEKIPPKGEAIKKEKPKSDENWDDF